MTPREEEPQHQPAGEPSVSTAPPRGRWRWGPIPPRLGPARTSTVLLAVLWLALGALYLNVRPETTGTANTGADTGVESPAPEPTTVAPTTTTATTTAGSTTTSDVPTTTTEAPTTSEPTATVPSGTTTVEPTTPPPSTLLPTPPGTAPTS